MSNKSTKGSTKKPCHYLANLLNSVYRGKKLKPEQLTEAQEYLFEIYPQAVPDRMSFMADNINLPTSMTLQSTLENTKPVVWWSCLERTKLVCSDLSSVAKRLLDMPASSASLERVFSNFG